MYPFLVSFPHSCHVATFYSVVTWNSIKCNAEQIDHKKTRSTFHAFNEVHISLDVFLTKQWIKIEYTWKWNGSAQWLYDIVQVSNTRKLGGGKASQLMGDNNNTIISEQ